jgi:predicted kinase
MMVGLPGSGKSTCAQKLSAKENATIYSSDTLREELFGDADEQKKNDELYKELHSRIKRDLQDNKNVIYDSTNISYKRRKVFLDEIRKTGCQKICSFVATPYEKCLQQNQQRDRKVPEYVIKKMYLNFYIPQYYEGWDEIHIIWNDAGYKFDIDGLFNGENGLNYISQDNPHHTLTIGEHCIKCFDMCGIKDLDTAALYHDIGKKFTKQFKNAKGEDTDIAHYYSHHLVSAYDSCFYLGTGKYGLDNETILNITNYIQWHMQPFFIETEKTKNKFIGLVGQEFYDNLMILHEADVKAK